MITKEKERFVIEKLYEKSWIPERQRNEKDKLPLTTYSSEEEAKRIGEMLYGKTFFNGNFKVKGV